jgi:hypothetical protein
MPVSIIMQNNTSIPAWTRFAYTITRRGGQRSAGISVSGDPERAVAGHGYSGRQ